MNTPAQEQFFVGHAPRECGEHRTTGYRAWCFDCHEWCSLKWPCKGCELAQLKQQLKQQQTKPFGFNPKTGRVEKGADFPLIPEPTKDG